VQWQPPVTTSTCHAALSQTQTSFRHDVNDACCGPAMPHTAQLVLPATDHSCHPVSQ
jgi:hypothetical protein